MKPYLVITQGTFPIAEFLLDGNDLEITLQEDSRTREVLWDNGTVLLPRSKDLEDAIGTPHGQFLRLADSEIRYIQSSEIPSILYPKGNLFFTNGVSGRVIEQGEHVNLLLPSLLRTASSVLVAADHFRFYITGFPVMACFAKDYLEVTFLSEELDTSKLLDCTRAAMWFGHYNNAKKYSLKAVEIDQNCPEAHFLLAYSEYSLNGVRNSKFINWHLSKAVRSNPELEGAAQFFRAKYL